MSDLPSVRLKSATAALHHRVEDGVDTLRRTETIADTVELLRRMEAFYRALEPILTERLQGRVPSEFLAGRVGRLRTDLDALDADWRPLPEPTMPVLEDPLGALYVLQGAALGGQIIGRHLRRQLSFSSVFFVEGAGPRWRAFRSILDECEDYEAVEASAVATFLAFEAAVVREAALV